MTGRQRIAARGQRGDLNPETREISPVRGNFHGSSITARCPLAPGISRSAPLPEPGGPGRGRAAREAGVPGLRRPGTRVLLPDGSVPGRARAAAAAVCQGRTQPRRSHAALPAEPGQAKYPPIWIQGADANFAVKQHVNECYAH
jgi:hypothetical protein